MTSAYTILSFFRRAPAPRDIYDVTPQTMYITWDKTVMAAAHIAESYNTQWNTYVSEYMRRYPKTTLEEAFERARHACIPHMVCCLDDKSRVECLEFNNVLAYVDECDAIRKTAWKNKLKLLVFLLFLVAAGGWYSLGYIQFAGFLVAGGLNVSVFLLDQYTRVRREHMEGIWIARVKILP